MLKCPLPFGSGLGQTAREFVAYSDAYRSASRDQQAEFPEVSIIGGRATKHVRTALLHTSDLAARHVGNNTRNSSCARNARCTRRARHAAYANTDTNPDTTGATDGRAQSSRNASGAAYVRSGPGSNPAGAADCCTRTSIDAAGAADRRAKAGIHAARSTYRSPGPSLYATTAAN